MDTIYGCEYEPQIFAHSDDVIFATEDFQEPLTLIATVSKKLKDTKFFRRPIKYLGYILEENGLRVDTDKVASKTVKEIRRFLGMTGWYQRFIRKYINLI